MRSACPRSDEGETARARRSESRDPTESRSILTASELRVSRIAAEGMTNREIAQALFLVGILSDWAQARFLCPNGRNRPQTSLIGDCPSAADDGKVRFNHAETRRTRPKSDCGGGDSATSRVGGWVTSDLSEEGAPTRKTKVVGRSPRQVPALTRRANLRRGDC